ncbi:MAG: J domain-containing protein [Pirellulales bacterium]|nr:J domain-containing protein [Pirellulales bacterium]
MTEAPDDPDWSLLPRDPVRFFRLPPEYDRRDLKRSYNQLLRRFKPERFPQEFQRIRAAYEQLENALRYGQSPEDTPTTAPSFSWDAPTASAAFAGTAASGRSSTPAVVTLKERIRTGSVTQTYRELEAREDKSPYDYYALAVMSDAVDRQDGLQFARWLLKGVAAHPRDVGLLHLINAYLNNLAQPDQAEQLLVECSQFIDEQMFFPITDTLWRELLRAENFCHFRSAWEKCNRNFKGIQVSNRLIFLVYILKQAIWVADKDWIAEAFEYLEQNYDNIPSHLEYDLEVLARLRMYILVREAFVLGNETRHRLDQAMRDYFCEDQLRGDQSVLACQILLAQDANTAADAFGELGNETYSPFYAVWAWVSYDVGERHVEPPKETLDEQLWHPRIQLLINDVVGQTYLSRLGASEAGNRIWYRTIQTITLVGSSFICCAVGVLLGAGVDNVVRGMGKNFDWIALGGLLGMIIGIALGFWGCHLITKRYWEPIERRHGLQCYHELWRPALLSFLARSHLSYQTFMSYLQSYANVNQAPKWLMSYAEQDYALPVFISAHRFMV